MQMLSIILTDYRSILIFPLQITKESINKIMDKRYPNTAEKVVSFSSSMEKNMRKTLQADKEKECVFCTYINYTILTNIITL